MSLNDISIEKELLEDLLETEKINLTTLSQVMYGNYLEIGCQIGKTEEWIMKLS